MIGFITKLFGTKSDKDIKEVNPQVDRIHEEYAKLSSLSHDQLRGKTNDLKKRIQDYISVELQDIENIQGRIENETEMDVDTKELLYKEIEAIEKSTDVKIEEVLKEILPEAFAI